MTRKILVHQCCAICSASFFEIIPSGFDVTGFWFNPNIGPDAELALRRESLIKFNEMKGVDTIAAPVDADSRNFAAALAAPKPARCAVCYEKRISEVARTASEMNFDAFSTTLLASPYQEHELAVSAAREAAKKFGAEFLYLDSRPAYYQGKNMARQKGLYSQKYCGCPASAAERAAELAARAEARLRPSTKK
jgi:hypothetical protein